MSLTQISADRYDHEALRVLVQKIEKALESHSDKDWNYSRICLELRSVDDVEGPYALWVDLTKTDTVQGRAELKALESEVAWGERHSNELGILELISLRLNKALLESAGDEHWGNLRPVVRLVRKERLAQQGITEALWYRVCEVSGEEFENR